LPAVQIGKSAGWLGDSLTCITQRLQVANVAGTSSDVSAWDVVRQKLNECKFHRASMTENLTQYTHGREFLQLLQQQRLPKDVAHQLSDKVALIVEEALSLGSQHAPSCELQ